MDNGKISTIIATLALIILGAFISNPQILSGMMGAELYAQYGALLLAILVAIYNYAYPRNKPVEN